MSSKIWEVQSNITIKMNSLDLVKDIKPADHYLRMPCASYDSYINSLCELLKKLEKLVPENKYRDLINKKLQTKLTKFNEHQYIQAACELTVLSEFIDRADISIEYEKKVTEPKDVDFSISINSKSYNIEVKCPSFKKNEKKDGVVELHFPNRVPSLQVKGEIIQPIKSELEKNGKSLVEAKSLDNTMKDFLLSTQLKVSGSSLDDVNILVVGCDDEINMHEWREYLFGYSGFFTNYSYIKHCEFNRVDYVLLTNIYNRHNKYFEDQKIDKHWHLSSSFNLLYPNKYSIRNQSVNGCMDLRNMNSLFPNHNEEFEKYLKDKSDVPIGENYSTKVASLGIAWYADKFKKAGIYYFRTVK